MHSKRTDKRRWRVGSIFMFAMLLISCALSACGDPHLHQRADQNRAVLDKQLAHARAIGVPQAQLQAITSEEEQLNNSGEPLSLFSEEPINQYYMKRAARYLALAQQTALQEKQTTQQSRVTAHANVNGLQQLIRAKETKLAGKEKLFQGQLTSLQHGLSRAQLPRDYFHVSQGATQASQAIQLLGVAQSQLQDLQQKIWNLQSKHVETRSFEQAMQRDLQLFRAAQHLNDFTSLIDQVNTQRQQLAVLAVQTLPYASRDNLRRLDEDIKTAKQLGINTASYQRDADSDREALANARTAADYERVEASTQQHLDAIQQPLIRHQAGNLLSRFHKEVDAWGNAHQYHNAFDGNSYWMDYEYDRTHGFGSDLDDAMKNARTVAEYQAASKLIADYYLHFKAMQADFNDKTPWNRVHKTDMDLMNYHQIRGQVIVVSFIEQALRLYQDGKLVRAFQVTTGQYDRPSPPGFWNVIVRQSPTVFKSGEPPGSPYWYPDTPIQYAMEYREGGYFIHDSWWRAYYGPGTNFPHFDPKGQQFAGNGSHGCVNLPPDDAGWLYANTQYKVPVILY